MLYLHGSRWDLTGQLFRIEQVHALGFSVLAIDYRGFGKSSGELPSEATVYEDAEIAWERFVTLQPDPTKRFIYGHSLGGAVAIDLAARLSEQTRPGSAVPARGLIVESTFTTLGDIARSLTVSWLPVETLLTQKFDSLKKITHVRLPVLIVHGVDDRMVPSRFSQDALRCRERSEETVARGRRDAQQQHAHGQRGISRGAAGDVRARCVGAWSGTASAERQGVC